MPRSSLKTTAPLSPAGAGGIASSGHASPIGMAQSATSWTSSPSQAHSSRRASSGGGKPTGLLMDRQTSLAHAVKKVEHLKALAAQREVETRQGQVWNEMFKKAANLRDPVQLQKFWVEVKARLVKRFSTLNAAFRHLDNTGDNSISFLEFSDMLRTIHIPLDMRICRSVFERASGSDRAMSVVEMKKMLMGETIGKLRTVMEGFNKKQERVQGHIQRFLRRLTQNDEVSRTRGIDRFQRKMTVEFCGLFFEVLRTKCDHPGNSLHEARLSRDRLVRIMKDIVSMKEYHSIRFQGYEVDFMVCIFDRLDTHKSGIVLLTSIFTALILLSPEPDRCKKMALLFNLFDDDYDECLLFDQVLALCHSICDQRPLVEEHRPAEDRAFQEELSAQEGLRVYECVRWHLQRSGKVDGNTVTMWELWSALTTQPGLIDALFPGTLRIHWAIKPSPADREVEERSLARNFTLSDLEGPVEEHQPRGTIRFAATNRPVPSLQSGIRTPSGRSGGPASAAAAAAALTLSRSSLHRPKKQLEIGGNDNEVTADEFKTTVTFRFRHQLQSMGGTRVAELCAGFDHPPPVVDQDGEGGAAKAGTQAVDTARASFSGNDATQKPPTPSLGRISSAPVLVTSPTASRPSSSPRPSLGGNGTLASATSLASLAAPDLPQVMPHQKWGTESADRFRLFSAVTGSTGRQRAMLSNAAVMGITHKCQVCHTMHTMYGDCGQKGK